MNLSDHHISQLKQQLCRADNWSDVRISEDTDLSLIVDVAFHGSVTIGRLSRNHGNEAGIRHTSLTDCIVGDDVCICDTPGGITRARIGNRAVIRNVASIIYEPEAPCGVGVTVDVLDETGTRPVRIYPGLSAQMAVMAARMPRWNDSHLSPLVSEHILSLPQLPDIADDAVIINSGPLFNVSVGREVCIDGARSLRNGSLINNAAPGRPLCRVGAGVDAENFIFEDAQVSSAVIARNVYAGQGVILEKGFSAHDSLFFANSSLENGEACALLAGPYTVSMHKGSLLIGIQTSFMNAGSASNQSNHMYKLGPVHWGVLERGVKTSSNSYLMLGANIGAFSLLMGSHKTHPDSTAFPFSYLFGDENGTTIVVPGAMLRSCGLMRDEKKWPARDRRLKRKLPLHDRIIFDVLTPFTVERMLSAIPVIEELLRLETDPSDRYLRWRGMKFSRASLERAARLYRLAIARFLISINLEEIFTTPDAATKNSSDANKSATAVSSNIGFTSGSASIGSANKFGATAMLPANTAEAPAYWIDLGGQILPRQKFEQAKLQNSVSAIETTLTQAFETYHNDLREWVKERFDNPTMGMLLGFDAADTLTAGQLLTDLQRMAEEFDRLEEEDRADYLTSLQKEQFPL